METLFLAHGAQKTVVELREGLADNCLPLTQNCFLRCCQHPLSQETVIIVISNFKS